MRNWRRMAIMCNMQFPAYEVFKYYHSFQSKFHFRIFPPLLPLESGPSFRVFLYSLLCRVWSNLCLSSYEAELQDSGEKPGYVHAYTPPIASTQMTLLWSAGKFQVSAFLIQSQCMPTFHLLPIALPHLWCIWFPVLSLAAVSAQ